MWAYKSHGLPCSSRSAAILASRNVPSINTHIVQSDAPCKSGCYGGVKSAHKRAGAMTLILRLSIARVPVSSLIPPSFSAPRVVSRLLYRMSQTAHPMRLRHPCRHPNPSRPTVPGPWQKPTRRCVFVVPGGRCDVVGVVLFLLVFNLFLRYPQKRVRGKLV